MSNSRRQYILDTVDRDPTIWISDHFRWDEFRCHDGTPVPARYRASTERLCELLEPVRAIWGRPVTVLSGYRSPAWNVRVEGAKSSQHMLGKAADIVVAGVAPSAVADAIDEAMESGHLRNGGLGRYKRWVHVDVGPPRRWRG